MVSILYWILHIWCWGQYAARYVASMQHELIEFEGHIIFSIICEPSKKLSEVFWSQRGSWYESEPMNNGRARGGQQGPRHPLIPQIFLKTPSSSRHGTARYGITGPIEALAPGSWSLEGHGAAEGDSPRRRLLRPGHGYRLRLTFPADERNREPRRRRTGATRGGRREPAGSPHA